MSQRAGLQRFALQLARNTHDAEDLLQATLLRAMEKMHLFQPDTNLFKWTSKIMYNLFVSGYRKKVRYETQYDPEYYINALSQNAHQDTQVELAEVNDAMRRLTTDHQEILVLIGVYGMRYDDVAKALNIPVGTVRSRLSRARQSLDNALSTSTTAAHMSRMSEAWRNNGRLPQEAAA